MPGVTDEVRALLQECCVAGARLGCETTCDHGDERVPQRWAHDPGDLPSRGPLRSEVLRDLDGIVDAPVLGGHSVRILSDGADSFGAMLQLVRGAIADVRFENFIFRADTVGRAFAQELRIRAADGVRVRVLHDPAGALMTGRRSAGVLFRGSLTEIGLFNVGIPTRQRRTIGRDHRKLVVADGAELVAGGICVADAWAGNCIRHCTWRDSAIHVRGPAAGIAGTAFDEAWAHAWRRTPTPRKGSSADTALQSPVPDRTGDVPVRILANLGENRPTLSVLERVIAASERSVLITNPYLVPPPGLAEELKRAARRGVEVALLIPRWNNHRFVGLSLEHGLGAFLEAGCRVFQWDGPMLHAKSVVVDGVWSLVGSTNLDMLSLHKNAELDVEVHGTAVAEEMTHLFRADCDASEPLTLREWLARSASRRAISYLATHLSRWQ